MRGTTSKKLRLLQPASPSASGTSDRTETADLVPRLGNLKVARRPPLSVFKEASISVAMTEMALHQFSQLPVMTGSRTVEGIGSWKTIGEGTLAVH